MEVDGEVVRDNRREGVGEGIARCNEGDMVFANEVIIEDAECVGRSEKSEGDMSGRHRREAAIKDDLFGGV